MNAVSQQTEWPRPTIEAPLRQVQRAEAKLAVAASVPVGPGPVGVAITPDGKLLYSSNYGDGTVTVVSTATQAVAATIAVGTGPWGVSAAPGGRRMYVACYGSSTITVIDTATNTVVSTITGMHNPVGLAVTPDGSRLYVACQATNETRVIDTATNTVIATVGVGVAPRNVTIGPNGLNVYVSQEGSNAISVIDTATNTVTATLTGFLFPRVPAITSDGRRMYVPNYGGNTVDVVDLRTNTVVASIPGFSLPFMIVIGASRLAYIANQGDRTVRVIDTNTNKLVSTYGGLYVPHFLTIAPNNLNVYVSNHGNSTISILAGLSGLIPNQGPTGGGTPVTIIGSHLTGATAVRFGSRPATQVVVVSDNEITAVTPAGQGVVNVTVTTPGGTSNPVPFYYILPPRVISLIPDSGTAAGGTTVTINGLNLATASEVTFGTTATTPTVLSDSQLTVTAPPHAVGAVPVVVTTIGGLADDATYTYLASPGVTSLSPTTGPTAGGTNVTIVGTNLAETTTVAFGTAAAPFTVVSDTRITAIAPPHGAGTVNLTVTITAGSVTAPQPYTYV